jgi:Fe-S oxidoreductase
MWLEEKIGKRINIARVEQALPHAPQVIATACPYCAVMMYDGVSALGKTDGIAVRDIAELVAVSMLRKGPVPGAPPLSLGTG